MNERTNGSTEKKTNRRWAVAYALKRSVDNTVWHRGNFMANFELYFQIFLFLCHFCLFLSHSLSAFLRLTKRKKIVNIIVFKWYRATYWSFKIGRALHAIFIHLSLVSIFERQKYASRNWENQTPNIKTKQTKQTRTRWEWSEINKWFSICLDGYQMPINELHMFSKRTMWLNKQLIDTHAERTFISVRIAYAHTSLISCRIISNAIHLFVVK